MQIDFNSLPLVTSPHLYLDKHYKQPHPNGILSTKIFGPLQNYRCDCGKYSTKILYNGLRCDVCGVQCVHSDVRYTTFAKIKLTFNVVRYQGATSLQKWLKSKKTILDPLQNELYRSLGIYLKYNQTKDTIDVVDIYNPNDEFILPLAITGIYTLYLGLYTIRKYFASHKAVELLSHFTNEVLVTPPATRPSIISDTLGSKKGERKILSSDLDEAYCRLLSTEQNNNKHKETSNIDNYYKMVETSIKLNTGIAINDEELRLFDVVSSFYQFAYDQIYDLAAKTLSGKQGIIRSSFLGKSVDFSSRSVIVTDPKLLTHEIRIPKASFIKLFFIEYLRYIRTYKDTDYKILRQLIRNSELNNVNDKLDYVDEFIEYFFTKTPKKDRLVICNRVPSLNFKGDVKFC